MSIQSVTPAAAAPDLVAEVDDVQIWQRALAAAHAQLQRSQAALIGAQKLEAIGRLAAGVAHEINTPVQYVSDNVAYLATGFEAMRGVLEVVLAAARAGELVAVAGLDETTAAELAEFLAEAPRALAESIEGLGRVASIVAALRSFSHPSRGQREPFDLNQGLLMTLTVARNEWRYLADVTTDLDPALPPMVGIRDELAQVFLNLIVNAAHAIEAIDKGRGLITVTSRHVGDQIVVQIRDTGIGIPDSIRHRVFEPFFTTKPVGRGTGQGLALAHAVVVDKHHGSIHFEPATAGGTTFIVTLPVGREAAP